MCGVLFSFIGEAARINSADKTVPPIIGNSHEPGAFIATMLTIGVACALAFFSAFLYRKTSFG